MLLNTGAFTLPAKILNNPALALTLTTGGSIDKLTEQASLQPAYLTGAGSLIIVCRDGSLAMMVGGILSQKTERNIKVLYGGLEAYWNEAGPAAGAGPVGGTTFPAATPRAPSVSPARSPASGPVSRPKKKSAGC